MTSNLINKQLQYIFVLPRISQSKSNLTMKLTLLLGDYNARNTTWWHHDITTTGGTQLETTTTIYGL